MRSRETDHEPQPRRAPNALTRLIAAIGRVIRLLLLSLMISVLIEWVGMTWWWPEQGVDHSQSMLQAELVYLDANVSHSLISQDPAEFARAFASEVHGVLFVKTRLINATRWLSRPPERASERRDRMSRWYRVVEPYVIAAMTIVKVFAARIAVLCLAAPLFVLVALLGLVDGLVQRDLRRWGGGRESSFLYHYAKRSNGAFLLSAGFIYLALPFSVPPVLIILPFAALFGISVSITASMFKKYL